MGKITKSIGIAGAVVGAAFLSKSENRDKVKRFIGLGSDDEYIKKLGRPGAVGATEDAKMVDEGAMTSVQYYNKIQEEEAEEK